MLNIDDTLMGHTKAHHYKFYVDSTGSPIMKYKIFCHNDDWLLKGDGCGVKLWKHDSEPRSLWPRGVPDDMAPCEMRHLYDVVKWLSDFVDHWERLSTDSVESRRIYEPLTYYWNNVKEALAIPFDAPPALQHDFWPSTQLGHSAEDEFDEYGTLRKDYAEDDHFVGHKRDRPGPSFRVA